MSLKSVLKHHIFKKTPQQRESNFVNKTENFNKLLISLLSLNLNFKFDEVLSMHQLTILDTKMEK